MFLGAAVALAPGWLSQARLVTDQDRAEQAALDGAEYVITRLRQNPNYAFGGSGDTGPRVTVNSQEMYVVEDHGNIVGLVWDASTAQPSQFRLRFNFQDGRPASETEQLSEPSAAMQLELPYLCVNNVPGSGDTLVPRVTGPGYSVEEDAPVQGPVPARSVYISVEGRAGPGLSSLARANPNAPVASGAVSRKLLQGIYKISNSGQPALDAVSASSGDLVVDLPPGSGSLQLKSSGTEPARVRAKGEIAVSGGGNPAVQTGKSAQLRSSTPPRAPKGRGVTEATEAGNDPFYRIGWNEVSKSKNSDTLAAGIYVVGESKELLYFDMTPDEYITWMSDPVNASSLRAKEGDDYVLPASVSFVPGADATSVHELRISKVVKVEPTTNTKTFAFMPKRGAPAAAPVPPSGRHLSLSTLNEDHFNVYSRPNPRGYTEQGYGGAEFGRALHSYLYGFQVLNNPQLDPTTLSQRLKVVGRDVDITVQHDGRYEIKNLPSHGIDQFLRELSKLNPIEAQQPDLTLEEVATSGGGQAVRGLTDAVTTQNLKLNLEPAPGSTAKLLCPETAIIGADVTGNGGSIVAEGDIELYGFGVDQAQNPDAQSGISLYSKGNINIQTFYQSGIDASGKAATSGFKDVCMRGVLYAWGNINAVLGNPGRTASWRNFNLTGSMVSYGGDPETNKIPIANGSFIYVKARGAQLEYDPSYLFNLTDSLPANLRFGRSSWSLR
jgi:hypothetical protein